MNAALNIKLRHAAVTSLQEFLALVVHLPEGQAAVNKKLRR
jgi:hypothetical protein